MYIPTWLVVFLIFLSSFSVWLFIIVSGFILKVFNITMKERKNQPQAPKENEKRLHLMRRYRQR